jgi:ADP-L-glycero-D-manno-heptose 6-epimerase
MIVVTGGAGLIGSAMVWQLNARGYDQILVVDDLGSGEKWRNLAPLQFDDFVHKTDFLQRIERNTLSQVEAIVHLGACSSTTERDANYLVENNYHYTRTVAQWCLERDVRFIYASSAATYGDGSQGYVDDESTLERLLPLNAYGYSKQLFDLWARRTGALRQIVGLKFFNVFGPNEYHKGDMASVVFKSFHQIMSTGVVQLFRSTDPAYSDGGQKRDFIYVKDCVAVIDWLLSNEVAGLFNLGTGIARSWLDLVGSVFTALGREPHIEFVEMPAALRGKYQNFTQADMTRLRATGCPIRFRLLEAAVHDYVVSYLDSPQRHLAVSPAEKLRQAA